MIESVERKAIKRTSLEGRPGTAADGKLLTPAAKTSIKVIFRVTPDVREALDALLFYSKQTQQRYLYNLVATDMAERAALKKYEAAKKRGKR